MKDENLGDLILVQQFQEYISEMKLSEEVRSIASNLKDSSDFKKKKGRKIGDCKFPPYCQN